MQYNGCIHSNNNSIITKMTKHATHHLAANLANKPYRGFKWEILVLFMEER